MNLDNNTNRKCCPVCQSLKVKNLGCLDYGSDVRFGSIHIVLQREPELCECKSCDSWFVNNILSEEQAVSLYAEGESDQRWDAGAFSEAKLPEVLETLSQIIEPGANIIDIGCNTGELLDFCASKSAVTCGVELSSSSRSVCQTKGHTVFESVAAVTGSFDVVFAFDLVEHLYDLPSFLGSSLEMLKEGGVLVILTGDNSSIVARRYQRDWWYLRYPEHILFPSSKSWRNQPGFRKFRKITTYASRGYRSKPASRLKALINFIRKKGNGLPLLSSDHHLVILQK
ncbi:class I SAM-dependent methyltransferase [Gammaproteobacteria bacterium]|nr:class I SAM-dependent methyltransferase [Gammaproteobacteria bacterium]